MLLSCKVDTSIIPPRQWEEQLAASADNACPPRTSFRKEKAYLRLQDITNMAELPQSMAMVKNTWEVNPAEFGHSNFRVV